MAREAIAVQPVLTPALERITSAVRQSREAAEVAATIAALKAQLAALILHDAEQIPMRDIGRVLGVSHQRVHQLLADDGDIEDLKDRLSVAEARLEGAAKNISIEKVLVELGLR